MKEIIIQEYKKRFGSEPEFLVQAPGRVNLIGEHTDYNEGFVLPMAIDRAIWIALSPRGDDQVHLHSLGFAAPAEFSLKELTHEEGWSEYIRGMAWALQEAGFSLSGWEGVLASDIPIASGLSSSAALELATARAFWSLTLWDWDPVQMAKTAKKMENEWLNLKSGIMDQMISACGEKGQALLIDCRDLTTELVPLPKGVSIVVMDTGVRRGLVDSAYNERVEQCQTAAAHFKVPYLRDVSMETFTVHSAGLAELPLKRARHIISENDRTLQAASAMRQGDALLLGELMNASHTSLQYDYEVSCTQLNIMVELARKEKGCLGARMTGGGFGGCAVALVEEDQVETFVTRVHQGYQQDTQLKPDIFPCKPSDGARPVAL